MIPAVFGSNGRARLFNPAFAKMFIETECVDDGVLFAHRRAFSFTAAGHGGTVSSQRGLGASQLFGSQMSFADHYDAQNNRGVRATQAAIVS